MTNANPVDELDKLRPLKEAAALSGLKYHIVQRAAKRGLVRTHSLGSSKRFVTLRDIFQAAANKPVG
jgi:hypothetical protein